jgi:hypothetical protein
MFLWHNFSSRNCTRLGGRPPSLRDVEGLLYGVTQKIPSCSEPGRYWDHGSVLGARIRLLNSLGTRARKTKSSAFGRSQAMGFDACLIAGKPFVVYSPVLWVVLEGSFRRSRASIFLLAEPEANLENDLFENAYHLSQPYGARRWNRRSIRCNPNVVPRSH